MNIRTSVQDGKQPSDVRGNQIYCINYAKCPLCFGCRAYDSRDPECRECMSIDTIMGRNYHICKTNIHEAWKLNNLISKNCITIDETVEFKNGGSNERK